MAKKRLYKSKNERVLFGVCGGLGKHFGIDPVLVRVAFIALVFAGGSSIVAYIALAILTPNEPDSAA
ncbi:MAG: PspC domain-containing protein [Dehalococcoidia bacterium]|nr:PspC domain-containing protein [Dehalococcoidia bacterium]